MNRWATTVLAIVMIGSGAEAQEPTEYDVKAAFLYNFAKFVEWPRTRPGTRPVPIQVCVLGENPFGDRLGASLKGKSVGGRALTVRLLPTAEKVEGCDIGFISRSEAPELAKLLSRLSARPILTVSDIEGFADRGGIIGLTMADKKVRFEVNMVAARKAQLKLSSRLLKVAVQIIGHLEEAP